MDCTTSKQTQASTPTRAALVAALLVLAPGLAAAQAAQAEPQPKQTLFVEALAGLAVHREGAIVDLRLRYRRPLYASALRALRDNYAGAGVVTQTAPSFTQLGVYAELAPVSFFRITTGYESIFYFGVLDSLRPLSGCQGVSKLDAADARCDFRSPAVGTPYSTADLGHRAWAEALLQAQVGPVIVTETFAAERWWFREGWKAGGGYDYWFNEMYSVPQRRADTLLTSSAALLLEAVEPHAATDWQLLVGVADDLVYVHDADYLTQRLGPVAAVRAATGFGLRDVAALLVVQLYTHDRYLRGTYPYVGFAVSASTDNFL